MDWRDRITDTLMRMFTPETAGKNVDMPPDPRMRGWSPPSSFADQVLQNSPAYRQGLTMDDPRMGGWKPTQPAPYENLEPRLRDLMRSRGY